MVNVAVTILMRELDFATAGILYDFRCLIAQTVPSSGHNG